jgi:hypothetical protein
MVTSKTASSRLARVQARAAVWLAMKSKSASGSLVSLMEVPWRTPPTLVWVRRVAMDDLVLTLYSASISTLLMVAPAGMSASKPKPAQSPFTVAFLKGAAVAYTLSGLP